MKDLKIIWNVSSWILTIISITLLITVYFDYLVLQVRSEGILDWNDSGFLEAIPAMLGGFMSIVVKIVVSFYLMLMAIFLNAKS